MKTHDQQLETPPFFQGAAAVCHWLNHALAAAIRSPGDPWHQGPITYLCDAQTPTTKTIVWRGWDAAGTGILDFYTDTRSAKWRALRANRAMSALFYCPQRLVQLTLKGQAHTSAGTDQDLALFHQLGADQMAAYQSVTPPGTPFTDQTRPSTKTIDPGLGAQYFGRVRLHCTSFDCVSLNPQGHQRLIGSSILDPNSCLWICP